jgi:hypothetical protein
VSNAQQLLLEAKGVNESYISHVSSVELKTKPLADAGAHKSIVARLLPILQKA